ncbi:hypothetical protein ACG873_21745 [Mesorhizobium sp. AaZ16]|uniref:hypothetical protein n=1 Tax=Mesorhizobium sp. AaZ16 TaxID=3402289 RepID=UPI00374F9243
MATVTYSFQNFVSEFVVNNTTANDQAAPDVAVLANGDLFFSFESDRAGDPLFQDVMFRRFDANGNALDVEDIVVSAGGGADDEDDSAVAVLSNGNVVVVNEDNDGGTEDDVEFHVFDPSGAGVNTQNIVTQAEGQATDNQTDPAVAALSGGGFVVVYTDEFAGSGTNTNAEFVIYNNDGSVRAGATIAGGNTASLAVSQPAVVGLTGGNFVVTWTEDVGGGDTNVKFRVYNSAGGSVSTEFTANADPDDQDNPVLAALPNGGFALAYVDQFGGSASDTEIEVKCFDASGNQVGNTGIIDFGSDLVSSPDIAVISSKYLLVSYTSDRNGDNDVLGQVFDFSGNKIGAEFNLEVTSSDQTASSLAGLGGGRFFAAWQDDDTVGDLSGYHVSAQGTEFVRTTTGDGTNETLTGDDLRDIIDGGAGADTMLGGAGNDTYYVDNIADKVIEANGAGTGTDTVRTTVSFSVVSQFVENIELLGSGSFNAIGNNLANTITGNAGNNAIDGRGGVDTMIGGAGNDTYYVDNVLDKTIEANVVGTDTVYTSVSKAFVDQFVEVIRLSGADNINTTGNNLDNTIIGNGANNAMNGRGGADTLTGGFGNDTFVFNTALGSGNIDTITDFNVANDTIQIDNAIFTTLGLGVLAAGAFRTNVTGAAQDADDRVIYESDSGRVWYDSNGNAAGGNFLFADLASGLALTNSDIVIV